jgi:hypothetical protein
VVYGILLVLQLQIEISTNFLYRVKFIDEYIQKMHKLISLRLQFSGKRSQLLQWNVKGTVREYAEIHPGPEF